MASPSRKSKIVSIERKKYKKGPSLLLNVEAAIFSTVLILQLSFKYFFSIRFWTWNLKFMVRIFAPKTSDVESVNLPNACSKVLGLIAATKYE